MAKKGGGAVQQPFQSNTNSTQTGTGTSSGTGTTTGTSTGTTGVTTPANFLPAWLSFQPGAQGFNPTQQAGVDFLTGALRGGDPAGLGLARGYMDDALRTRSAPTLRNLAAIDPGAYGAPPGVTAQQIAARKGSEFMGDYQSPYTKDVVDTSLAQFDFDAGKARAALRGENAGAFANKRFGVAEGEFAANSTLDRAQLGAGLRDRGFNTAAGLGMQDASRFLSADASNADRALQAGMFNNQQAQARNMFDANLGMQFNDQRDRLARDVGNLGVTNLNAGSGLASGLINAGATGQGQNLDWLSAAVPTFGTTNTQTNNQTNAFDSRETNEQRGTGLTSGFQTGINPSGGKGGSMAGLGSLLKGAAAVAPFFCWVAREVYGEHNPQWLKFRAWMLAVAPRWLRALYIKHGEKVAAWIKNKPRVKQFIRWWMDSRISSLKGYI